jgi:hypothetical protein
MGRPRTTLGAIRLVRIRFSTLLRTIIKVLLADVRDLCRALQAHPNGQEPCEAGSLTIPLGRSCIRPGTRLHRDHQQRRPTMTNAKPTAVEHYRDEGRRAARSGRSKSDNPYSYITESLAAYVWDEGFDEVAGDRK